MNRPASLMEAGRFCQPMFAAVPHMGYCWCPVCRARGGSVTSLAPGPVSRRVGCTGMAVYPIALDASVFGWAADAKTTSRTLDLFYAAGGDLISTADHYAGGRSEIMIGSWLSRHASRERLVVATKVGKHPDAHGLSRAAIHRAVDA